MRKSVRKLAGAMLCAGVIAMSVTGCGNSSSTSGSGSSASGASDNITVISREDGSGTRGAFIELFGIEEKDADGNKVDKTTDKASITNNTSVMMTSVSGDPASIGYASLGSLNDTVKALKVDGVEATIENVKNDTYKIARPFNIVNKDDLSALGKDFEKYILSSDGQKIVEDNGYIAVAGTDAFTSDGSEGKLTVAGSSSVSPVMEKLIESYQKINTKAEIDLQTNDSTTGISSTSEGVCDIGMASRDLKDEESGMNLTTTKIAMDGIAVIVNKDNKLDDISADAVKNIYTGATTSWADVSK